jgi:RED-like protein N-terminal region
LPFIGELVGPPLWITYFFDHFTFACRLKKIKIAMADGGDKPLTNADFRKILFTPRPGAKPDLAQQAKEQQQRKDQSKAKPRPKPKQQQGGAAGGAGKAADGSDEDDGPSYRDRAAERRKGLGTEHNDDIDAAGFLGSTFASAAAAPDLSHLSYEETKYLGGDLSHTHLVKGLDFALLSKIRSEQTQQEHQQGGLGDEGAAQQQQPVSFSGPMGRAVYNILFRSQQNQAVQEDVAERFLPRRTAFVFNVNDQGIRDIFEVPTTLLRAKEDCPAPPKVLEASSDAVVLERLGKIMAYMAMGSGGSKNKLKKERKQELLVEAGFIQPILPKKNSDLVKEEEDAEVKGKITKPLDEEEDIFADAGTDYVAERRTKKDDEEIEEGAATKAKRVKYFGSDAPTALESGDMPPIAQPKSTTTGVVIDQAEERRKAKEKEARDREMLASVGAVEDDGYAECYPSYYDAAGDVYDSEDDDGTGMAKVKTGDDAEEGDGEEDGKGGGKSVKDRGLAARKEAARLAMKEKQKQDAELNKLQKVFEEKGYGNAGAFGAKSGEEKAAIGEKGGGGTAAGEAIPGAVPPMPTAKRRRI